MQIACPTCATSYEVSASSIGATGRSVRCVRCRAIWFASPTTENTETSADDAAVAAFRGELGDAAPFDTTEASLAATQDPSMNATDAGDAAVEAVAPHPAAETPTAPDIETAAASAYVSDHPVDLDAGRPPIVIDETPTAEAPPSAANGTNDAPAGVDSLAARRQRRDRRPPPKAASSRRIPAVILALLALIGALIGWRVEVVRRAPQMASLYAAIGMPVNLRKMVFADIRLAKETHDGVPVLLLEGTIVSTSPATLEVPRLRFAVRNSAGAELYSWTAPAPQAKLAPFETLAFRSRLASPPGDSRDIVVRFFNRGDAVAN